MMFIRFVIKKLDPDSGRRQGLFQAAIALRKSGVLTDQDYVRLENIRDWFNQNLERPARLALSSRPHVKAQAISWFKDSANQHIRKMHEFKKILESYGIGVEIIRTMRPGYIVFEDEFQVAAYSFKETKT